MAEEERQTYAGGDATLNTAEPHLRLYRLWMAVAFGLAVIFALYGIPLLSGSDPITYALERPSYSAFIFLGYVGGIFLIKYIFTMFAVLLRRENKAFLVNGDTLSFSLDARLCVHLDDVVNIFTVKEPLLFFKHRYLLFVTRDGREVRFPLDFVVESDEQVRSYVTGLRNA